jgi:hypothetical protein
MQQTEMYSFVATNGHLACAYSDNEIIAKVFNYPRGRRDTGLPRKRWIEAGIGILPLLD